MGPVPTTWYAIRSFPNRAYLISGCMASAYRLAPCRALLLGTQKRCIERPVLGLRQAFEWRGLDVAEEICEARASR